jgi:DNA-binding SARP family transcriptional activator/ABC-type branched-subunit amino acid transport system substrate-binding protein/DNA-binding beta-propeller fold protein YncE
VNGELDFRLLGPLEVWAGEDRLALGGRKQRALLAILLLHADEVVSVDRLIDLIWGESPPGTAATALHGHVSQLRKLLEPGREPGAPPEVLVTLDPGYVLRIQPEQLDLERFSGLVASARAAQADGRPAEASETLASALALWRGPPLSDLENEPFAQAELPRLVELQLAAIEERFDAELALGREHELISEIEGHISRHPMRERPRGQLMLALYRAGRQAEALRAYQSARRMLVEDVGIEPGSELRRLERAILEQDPALDLATRPPASAPAPSSNPPRRDRHRVAGAGAAALLVAAVLLAVALGRGSHDPSAAAVVRANSVVAIDLETGRLTDVVALGGTPTSVSVADRAVWALDADRQVVSRIDPRTHAVRTFGTGSVPTDLAAGAGALWVANGKRSGAQFVGPLATTVSAIDRDSGAIRSTVKLPRAPGATSNANASHIAVTPGAVWVVNPDFSVSNIDPRNGEIASTDRTVDAVAVAAGEDAVWALEERDSLVRLDGGAGSRRVRLATNGLSGLAVGEGAVWATSPYDGILWRVDPTPRLVERTIAVGVGASAVTVGGGAVWVDNALRGTVSQVDPASNRVERTIDLGGTPRSAAVGAGRLWVTVGAAAPSATSVPAGVDALPAETCGQVFYGGKGTPDRLIVSDMPLRAAPALPTRQMSEAIAFVLRQRGFRAGRFNVGYQSCDDSTAQAGIDDTAKCAANAKAFAAKRTVIGIVGPYNSDCAIEEIPIAGRAPGGPLAMISPTNSLVGLTRATPDSPEGGLRALYPTGRRNYARLYPTEAAQGVADALLARRLGARRVFVLSDGGYGEGMARPFGAAARRLGLRVAGMRRWNQKASGYRDLAGDVARARPDAVFVSGLLDTNGGAVIKALRARLASRVTIIAGDGFLPISKLFAASGSAARDVLVSIGGVPPERLGPEGRNFVSEFAALVPDRPVRRDSVHAAAAAAALLDAIARSDGTRADVTRRLLAIRSRRGILAPFRLDARGDIVPSSITIVRARRGGGAATVDSVEGATIDRVIRLPAAITK